MASKIRDSKAKKATLKDHFPDMSAWDRFKLGFKYSSQAVGTDKRQKYSLRLCFFAGMLAGIWVGPLVISTFNIDGLADILKEPPLRIFFSSIFVINLALLVWTESRLMRQLDPYLGEIERRCALMAYGPLSAALIAWIYMDGQIGLSQLEGYLLVIASIWWVAVRIFSPVFLTAADENDVVIEDIKASGVFTSPKTNSEPSET